MNRPVKHPGAVSVDAERFAEVERLAAYEIGNGLLLMNLDLQRCFGLRAEQYQVFMLIVVATVQRCAWPSAAATIRLDRVARMASLLDDDRITGKFRRRRCAASTAANSGLSRSASAAVDSR